ncbi:transglutaminase-like cysteine peptidase [Roseateles sp. PN1]
MLFCAQRAKVPRPGLTRRWLLRVCASLALTAGVLPTLSYALDRGRWLEAATKVSPRALAEAQQMLQLIERATAMDEVARVSEVNGFVNKHIEFRDDIEVWGKIDYWASPLESLAKGQGDCEDYAIAKYFALLSAGMPVAKLRMVYVRASLGGRSIAHMVLAYYAQPSAEPLILDNLIADVRPASQRPDLQPVFSFNGEGLWQGVGATSAGDPLQRLSLWRDLLAKARAEGF